VVHSSGNSSRSNSNSCLSTTSSTAAGSNTGNVSGGGGGVGAAELTIAGSGQCGCAGTTTSLSLSSSAASSPAPTGMLANMLLNNVNTLSANNSSGGGSLLAQACMSPKRNIVTGNFLYDSEATGLDAGTPFGASAINAEKVATSVQQVDTAAKRRSDTSTNTSSGTGAGVGVGLTRSKSSSEYLSSLAAAGLHLTHSSLHQHQQQHGGFAEGLERSRSTDELGDLVARNSLS
jgi:hypothetical protein